MANTEENNTNDVTVEQLTKINGFSHKQLAADEVFIFPIILCDNKIDRDYERFTAEAINDLAPIYVGKPGIFDHNMKSESQNARIFDTETVESDEVTENGEKLCMLKGWAYMVRTDENASLIKEIDGGIKKEVSVDVRMKSMKCSICGAQLLENPCAHIKGRSYGGKICCTELSEPSDAYEWSFVAVPAQVAAGVTKSAESNDSENDEKEQIKCDIIRMSYFC